MIAADSKKKLLQDGNNLLQIGNKLQPISDALTIALGHGFELERSICLATMSRAKYFR